MHAQYGALAADELALDDGDAQAAFGERAGAVLARRAAAEDDDVVVAHVGSSAPACSATMYAAYQSGQFSSRLPVRFSCSPWAAAAPPQRARQVGDARRTPSRRVDRPGSRVVISCSSQPLPSGSLNVAKER